MCCLARRPRWSSLGNLGTRTSYHAEGVPEARDNADLNGRATRCTGCPRVMCTWPPSSPQPSAPAGRVRQPQTAVTERGGRNFRGIFRAVVDHAKEGLMVLFAPHPSGVLRGRRPSICAGSVVPTAPSQGPTAPAPPMQLYPCDPVRETLSVVRHVSTRSYSMPEGIFCVFGPERSSELRCTNGAYRARGPPVTSSARRLEPRSAVPRSPYLEPERSRRKQLRARRRLIYGRKQTHISDLSLLVLL
ncbi:hypothetical protein PsYK624_070650 [Phanerochaete sordida]|uniref:Uncharacterized protein n=1 Tax=Phanerochaete sordida TaxID=48140 RepID=A0A9P3GBQ2_9APHY|nr:hypothetical protein PsYK624_070650 [Phanerochaete sordida]